MDISRERTSQTIDEEKDHKCSDDEKIEQLINSTCDINSKKPVPQFITLEQREAIKIICHSLISIPNFKLENINLTVSPTAQYVHFNIRHNKLIPPIFWRLNKDVSIDYYPDHMSNKKIHYNNAQTAAKSLKIMLKLTFM